MASNDNNTFMWKPILASEFRTVEFRHSASDNMEEQIRAQRVSEQGLKELAKEVGFTLDESEFEIDDDRTIDPEKRLLEQFEYLQAFQEGETWTVQSVKTTVLQNGKETQQAYIAGNNKKLTALEAIGKLTAFEGFALSDVAPFELPTSSKSEEITIKAAREELASRHFIYAGEQEGLLFDDDLNAYQRTNKFVLPSGTGFDKNEIARANKRWEEGEKRITNLEVSAETLLEEMAANVPANTSIDRVLRSIKATSMMDEFARKIDSAADNLDAYTQRYTETEQGHYIEDAIDDLINSKTGAMSVLNRLKSEHVMRDVTEWTNFVKEAHVACHVVHAQAMLHLLKTGKISGDKERQALEKSLRMIGGEENADGKTVKVGDMEKIANKYNLPGDVIAKAKRAMGISTGPTMPKLLTGYLSRYKERKKVYLERQDKGQILEPEAVLPPTRKLVVRRPGM